MAKGIAIDLNLLGNELQNFTLQHLAVAPENPKEGQPYFNTVEERAKIYENGEWRNLTADEAKDWTDEIDAAKVDAVDKALERAIDSMQTVAENVVYDTKMQVELLSGRLSTLNDSPVNYNEKLAEVLRIQDPTINRLIKDIALLSEDEKRAITDPVKQELETKLTEKIDGLLGGASEDLDTLKELGDKIGEFGTVVEAVKTKADIATAVLSNEPTGVHTVSHTLNSEDVIVSVYDTSKNEVLTDVTIIDANTVRITVAAGLNLTGYKVVLVG